MLKIGDAVRIKIPLLGIDRVSKPGKVSWVGFTMAHVLIDGLTFTRPFAEIEKLVGCVDCLDGAESCICDDDEWIGGGNEYFECESQFIRDDHGRWWRLETALDPKTGDPLPGATLTYDDGEASFCICFDV